MSRFYIERVRYSNGSEEYEIKMKSQTPNGVGVMITSRNDLGQARSVVRVLDGRQEFERTIVE